MNAGLSLAADGVGGGHAGLVSYTSGSGGYSINPKTKPVGSTTAGVAYVADGMFRSSAPGQTVCLRVKEYNTSNIGQGEDDQCATATSAWQPFPTAHYTTLHAGDTLTVRVYQATAASGQSFEVDNLSLALGATDTTPPTVPTGLTATAVGSAEIDLSWTASTDTPDGVAGYTVYRDGSTTPLATVGGTVTTYQDTSVVAGSKHSYKVDAFDSSGNHSARSTAASATTPGDTTVPTTPTGVTATAVSAGRVDVGWTASTDPDGVSGYHVYRDGTLVGSTTGATAFSDLTTLGSVTYAYTVTAFDSVNESPPSAPVSVTTPAPTGSPIKHVVIIYQENNSFDEVLGYTCAVTLNHRCDGATSGKISTGATIALRQAPDIVPTVNHSPGSITTGIDGGKMDGFNLNSGCTQSTNYNCYVQYQSSQIPNLAAFAGTYVVADRTFESKVSASWGSHMDLVAASLDGFQGVNPSHSQFANQGWGCDSGATASWKDPTTGAASTQPTCIPKKDGSGPFRASPVPWIPTIMDRMDAGGVSWHIYAPTSAQQFYGWSICPTFADCLYTGQVNNTSTPGDVLTAADAGTLPNVSYVVGLNTNTQHNSNSMLVGDNWIGSVVNHIMNGPDWKSTAIFITYDDCGCFYDHVPPPAGAGVREPMVIVSPCTATGTTDHNTAYAGESTLAFIEKTFSLQPLLASADGSAYDYSSAFSYAQPGCGGAGPAPPTVKRATYHPVSAAELAYIAAHPDDPNDPT